MKTASRAAALAVVAVLTVPLTAGKGNGIPPGVNPFEYILGLIAGLQSQINALPGGGGGGCQNLTNFAGRWTIANAGTGTTGEVTFDADGTYIINSGFYAAGGSGAGISSGEWEMLEGGAIAFTWNGSASVDRIAVIQCSPGPRVAHALMGSTLDYEVLSKVRVE
jgi:hypothetical protein